MITTKISITPYLAEYIIGKYNHCNKGEVKIPDTTDLYHLYGNICPDVRIMFLLWIPVILLSPCRTGGLARILLSLIIFLFVP